MSAKHTPGPWHASAIRTHGIDASKNGCDIGAENGANVAIALHQPEDREQAETIANAKLIAAAPRLLRSLQEVLEQIEELSDYTLTRDT